MTDNAEAVLLLAERIRPFLGSSLLTDGFI
jgi:hypothetical protein